ncbi:MAG: tRNA guanosine(15) transglycosylase TgtA, partial [Halobacteriaceae archaeon]
MRDIFEIRSQDGAGRIGELSVPRSDQTIETPALLPVVNPNRITVPPSDFETFDVEILITNSYIIYGDDGLKEQALTEGLHDMLSFDGAIMTDSGSFQLAEYGNISVDPTEILEFQHAIGSDIGTPIDIPTPPDANRDEAKKDLEITQERIEQATEVSVDEMLINAPIQGGLYPDLRERAAKHAYNTSLDIFPIGAAVPLMNSYRFDDIVDISIAAKQGLRQDAPVHLFGAGHPMIFALAVALGCDLFDSAAYALYARDGRYLTPYGTKHLESLEYFPCGCPICQEYTPDEVRRAN